MLDRMIVIVCAFLLDSILGDPHFLWHPVCGIGRLISWVEKCIRREKDKKNTLRIKGFVLVLIVVSVSTAIPLAILWLAERVSHIVRLVLEIIMCYQLFAARSLAAESLKVYKALIKCDIEEARYAVSMIVGRDTDSLDEEGITRAAVETVAENTSDGVIAPLIYMFIGGAAGGFFYKAVNTMDSMIGYKNYRYEFFGTAAAKLDDLLNLIPSRVSAIFMILAAGLCRYDMSNAFKIWRRDRRKHASPNSAQTESVCAGALNVQLAGDAYYFGKLKKKPFIGDAIRDIEPADIKRADILMYVTSFIALIIGEIVLIILLLC